MRDTKVDASFQMMLLNFRSANLAKLFVASPHDSELAQNFRADPRRYIEECGISVPRDVTIEIHSQYVHTPPVGGEVLILSKTCGPEIASYSSLAQANQSRPDAVFVPF